MSDPVAAGPLSIALAAFRTLLSNVEYFQTWTGTDNADDAAGHIFLGEIGAPVKALSVSAGVLTVELLSPVELIVGQEVTIEGCEIGDQGTHNLSRQLTILTVAGSPVPWVDLEGNQWRMDTGEPLIYTDDADVMSFTALINADDCAEFDVTDAILIPCARPYAIVTEQDDSINIQSIGTGNAHIVNGILEVMFEARVSPAYKHKQRLAGLEARNAYGQLVAGIIEIAGTGDYMSLREITQAASPTFSQISEQRDNTGRFELWQAMIRCAWGLGA